MIEPSRTEWRDHGFRLTLDDGVLLTPFEVIQFQSEPLRQPSTGPTEVWWATSR